MGLGSRLRVILEPACRHQSIEHTASAVFVAFWLVLPFREGGILYVAFINQAGGLYGKILTEVVGTDRT